MSKDFYTVRGYEQKYYNKNIITPAMEDYIEMIYRHTLKNDYVRINQLSKSLNVKDSSASKMVQKLASLSLLNYKKYGIITLTEEGEELGSVLLKRHNIIEDFLIFLDCKEDILVQTELIEHNLSDETVNKINMLLAFFNNNPDILNRFIIFKSKYKKGI